MGFDCQASKILVGFEKQCVLTPHWSWSLHTHTWGIENTTLRNQNKGCCLWHILGTTEAI